MRSNILRWRKVGGRILLVSDSGAWIFLDPLEFEGFMADEISHGLHSKLKANRIILDQDNESAEIAAYKAKKDFVRQGTSLHIMIPTLRCNQRCVYCHASSRPMDAKGVDMDKDTANKAIEFILQSPAGSIEIEFQGGEPLVDFGMVKHICKTAKVAALETGKMIRFSMTSNLLLMDQEKLDFLIDHDVAVCTSLDGPRDVHDKSRGHYDELISKIHFVNSVYQQKGLPNRLGALFTLTRTALSCPKDIIDEYIRLGMDQIHIRWLNPLGSAQDAFDEVGCTPQEYIEFWKASMEYILEKNRTGTRFIERQARIMLHKILRSTDPNYLEMRSPCGAVTGQLAYGPDGKIYTCDEGRMIGEGLFCVGDAKMDSYKEVLESPTSLSMINASITDSLFCDTCAYKPWCGVCPVMNYAEQGSLIGDIVNTPRHKIFLAQFDWIFMRLQIEEDAQILRSWVN